MKQYALAVALACAASAWAASPDWTCAEVVKVQPERSRVILRHEPIKSIGMEAMTMPFKADQRVDLKRFKTGDKIRFTVSNKDDHLIVDAMENAK
jgi:Cu(I)/Ag(I) efflux system protein CusF